MEDQFQLLFDKMKIEMHNQTAELKDSITKCIMEKMEEKLIPIVEENKALKIQVKNLENEIEYMKIGKRNNNIILFGLEETEKTTHELLQIVKNILKSDLDISILDHEVNKIHRIGNKNTESNKHRPILCTFVSNWRKNEIIKNKKKFKKIYVTEDYPKEVLEKRKALQSRLVEERNKGNIAYLKYDKLIVKGNVNNLEKRKRETSTSPSATNMQAKKKQLTSSSTKPNRANAFDRMRSSSLSIIPTTKTQ